MNSTSLFIFVVSYFLLFYFQRQCLTTLCPNVLTVLKTRIVDTCLLTIIIITAARINIIPSVRRGVIISPNTITPITTAVNGSSAPIMAVGVEPTNFTAIAIVTSDTTVGKTPNHNAENNERIFGNACKPPVGSKKEAIKLLAMHINRT